MRRDLISFVLVTLLIPSGLGGTPPQFVGDPNRLHRMKEGANLKLKCPIEGSEPFDIEWFKDDERIDPSTWSRASISGQYNQYLRMRRVSAIAGSGGIYACKGVNGYGARTFRFSVVVGDSAFPTELLPTAMEDMKVHSGDSFSLTCSLRNPGHAELRWLKRLDGIRPPNSEKDVVKLEDQLLYRHLQPSPRLFFSDSIEESRNLRHFTLSVSNASVGDTGNFVCLAVNSHARLDNAEKWFHRADVVIQDEKALSATSSSKDVSGGISELTVLVMVLPVLAVILFAVLIVLIVHSNKTKKNSDISNSTGKKNTPLDETASSEDALLQQSNSFAFASSSSKQQQVPLPQPPQQLRHGHQQLSQPSVFSSPGIEQRGHRQRDQRRSGSSTTLTAILARPRVYQIPGSRGNKTAELSDQNAGSKKALLCAADGSSCGGGNGGRLFVENHRNGRMKGSSSSTLGTPPPAPPPPPPSMFE